MDVRGRKAVFQLMARLIRQEVEVSKSPLGRSQLQRVHVDAAANEQEHHTRIQPQRIGCTDKGLDFMGATEISGITNHEFVGKAQAQPKTAIGLTLWPNQI